MSDAENLKKIYPPSEEVIRNARVKDYESMYKESIEHREEFWAREADELEWYKKWDKVLDDSEKPFYKWFVGGQTNIIQNALDRHLKTATRNKVALIWEGEPGDIKVYSYHALSREVSKFANVLRSMGVQKGEVVTIYMPQIPELIIAMLACAKIGAVHSVVYGGFSVEALAERIEDAHSRVLITARRQKTLSHTASPEASAIDDLIGFWNDVRDHVADINRERNRPWEILQSGVEAIDSGGDGMNIWAEMKAGFRLPLDISPDEIRFILAGIADEHDVHLTFGGGEPAYRSDKNNPLVRAFLGAIRAQNGKPGFVVKTGTSDMNVVGPVWNIPIIAYGAGDSALDHTPEEHIVIAEWARSVAVLADALDRLMTA